MVISSPEKCKKFAGSQFLKFYFFAEFFWIPQDSRAKNRDFFETRENPGKSMKNQNFKNPLPTNFLHSSELPRAKKNWVSRFTTAKLDRKALKIPFLPPIFLYKFREILENPRVTIGRDRTQL